MEFDFSTTAIEGISGRYRQTGGAHYEKPIYRKNGPHEIFLYFYGEGGVRNEGWWIGPEVGGQQVRTRLNNIE